MFDTLVKTIAKTASVLAISAAFVAPAEKAEAQASDPFIGQMMTVGFNFCPRGWAQANGQLLAISSNTALFSLLGTTYGGDGRTTFGLPDLRGRYAANVGTGPGLSNVTWGQRGGAETHTMTVNEMPSHNHIVNATNERADQLGPGDDFLADPAPFNGINPMIYHDGPANRTMNPGMIAHTGGGLPFNIKDPFLGMYVCIATVGVYPSRS